MKNTICAGTALGCALIGIALVFSAPVYAVTTFTVNSTADVPASAPLNNGVCETALGNGICTLRAAIMKANNVSGAGVTILLPAGLYTLSISAAGANGDDSGDLNLIAPAFGNPVISLTGAGASITIIDANQLDRVFNVAASRSAIISGVTIRNGFAAPIGGGGILNHGSLTLNDATLSGNFAATTSNGGGGVNNDGAMTLNNTMFSNNSASNGGGIANALGTMTLNNATLSSNSANATGGAITNGSNGSNGSNGTITINTSTLSSNSARTGGGIATFGGVVTLTNSALVGNLATNTGGGIFNLNGTMRLSHCTLSNNAATTGGGIYSEGALFLVNSTLYGNRATSDGGGILNDAGIVVGTANIYNTSIVFNQADSDADPLGGSGGGVYNRDPAVFNLRNSLVAGNTDLGGAAFNNCTGTLHSFGRNLFGNTSGCTVVTNSGSWGTLNFIDRLGTLQDNGGPTQTVALLPGSNAIDGGDPVTGCVDQNSSVLTTDQRGFARVVGARCDIGAFEYVLDPVFSNSFE
jgi:CSLREA domain-containing protein